jgi:hypothetical protein
MEQLTSSLPDLANPPKIRQRRAPKHDFKDGNGKVFAHHHDNGGGWVADTAYVAPSARVNRNAAVFGFARVTDTCSVEGRARVCGRARLADAVVVAGDAQISGDARLCDNVVALRNARVSERARLSGNTRVEGNVHVFGSASLRNTRCQNTSHKFLTQQICGSARVNSSYFYGLTQVSGNAICENASLMNAVVTDAAFIVDSRIATAIAWGAQTELNGITHNQFPPFNFFCRVVGAHVVGSQLSLGPCAINAMNLFLHCRLSFDNIPAELFTPREFTSYIDLQATDPTNVRSVNDLAARAGLQAAPNLAPQTSIAAVLTSSTQRRILRLETTQ